MQANKTNIKKGILTFLRQTGTQSKKDFFVAMEKPRAGTIEVCDSRIDEISIKRKQILFFALTAIAIDLPSDLHYPIRFFENPISRSIIK